jgi:hypothetical protein
LTRQLQLWTSLLASRFCLLPALAAVLSLGTLGVETASAFTADSCNGKSAYSVVGDVATCTYAATGEYAFKVPADVNSLEVRAIGGKGAEALNGPSAGGFGAEVSSELEVNAGSQLEVRVAGNGVLSQGGYGGGGWGTSYAGGGGGGGGASAIIDPENDEEEMLVAGGGGGGGGHHDAPGGDAEANGSRDTGNPYSGGGGGASIGYHGGAGGSAGVGVEPFDPFAPHWPNGSEFNWTGNPGTRGTRGQGGEGGYAFASEANGSGGGGGGGYFGGGGGGGGGEGGEGGGGGGGSSIGNGENTVITAARAEYASVTVSWKVAAPSATITSPVEGATYEVGQTVAEDFSCAEGPGGTVLTSCLDQNGQSSGGDLETLVPGQHTVTVTAISEDGQEGTEEVEYTVAEAPTATITSPANGATYTLGQAVPEEFICAEGTGGPGLSSCLDQSGNPTGTNLETLVPGPHTLTVTAISADGQTATTDAAYTVEAPPTVTVDTPGVSGTYGLGQAVPEKFNCTEGAEGPGLSSCLDQNGNLSGTDLDTSTLGTHTLTVTATSSDGQTGTTEVEYTVAEPPTATVYYPIAGEILPLGKAIREIFGCAPAINVEGQGLDSCLDSNGKASADINTSTIGKHTMTAVAVAENGLVGEDTVEYTVAAPPTVTFITPTAGATYTVGQTVAEEFTCGEGAGGPGLASCLDQNGNPSGTDIDTATPGQYTLTVTATSQDGQTGTAELEYTVAESPTVTITSPASTVYAVGQMVAEDFSCAPGVGAPGISSCLDQNGNPSGTDLDTAALGEHTLTVTATSTDGQTGTGTVTYNVSAAPAVPTPTPVPPAVPAPLPPAPPPPTPPPPTPPVVSDLQVLHSCLTDAALGTPHPGRDGLAVSFDLSEAATVSYTVERREGSVAQAYCSALRPGHPRPGGQPGQYEEVGSGQQPGASAGDHTTKIGDATAAAAHKQLTSHSPAGQRHVSLTALGRHLAPGTYIVSLSATNAAGETSNKALAYVWVLK